MVIQADQLWVRECVSEGELCDCVRVCGWVGCDLVAAQLVHSVMLKDGPNGLHLQPRLQGQL